MTPLTDEHLIYATPTEAKYAEAYNRLGSQEKVAAEFGVNNSSVSRALASLKKRAAGRGHSPEHDMTHVVPEGFHVKGVSTLFDAEGKPKVQWVKSAKDRDQRTLEALQSVIADLISEAQGVYTPREVPTESNSDLLCVYPLADSHIGLYAWGDETGEDWDADMAVKAITEAMFNLVAAAPAAETALLANLADFFHADNSTNETLRSHHKLDVDTRYARVFQIGVRCYRALIDMALTKHKTVIFKAATGNHDDHTGLALAMLMQAYFEKEPRVTVELPINPFAYYQFGQTLFGINHGMVKADKLPGIMANDQRELWGQTRFHTWLTGHIHHKTGHEFPGCTVESFRTPGAKDSWSHGAGYRAERDMVMIKVHRENGEVGRTIEAIY